MAFVGRHALVCAAATAVRERVGQLVGLLYVIVDPATARVAEGGGGGHGGVGGRPILVYDARGRDVDLVDANLAEYPRLSGRRQESEPARAPRQIDNGASPKVATVLLLTTLGHTPATAWWCGGVVVRWCGGAVVRWFGGSVVRWCGGAVVRWCCGWMKAELGANVGSGVAGGGQAVTGNYRGSQAIIGNCRRLKAMAGNDKRAEL